MTIFRFLVMVIGVAVTGACTTQAQKPQPAPVEAADPSSLRFLTGLPPQNLAPNECGLFLWSKTDISKFVFFKKAGEQQALFYLDTAPARLEQTSFGGTIFGQFYTQLSYRTDTGQDIELSYQPGVELEDGARIASGTIQYTDKEGWRTVLPILGARVCKPVVEGPQSVTQR